jgi:hypothetical protein
VRYTPSSRPHNDVSVEYAQSLASDSPSPNFWPEEQLKSMAAKISPLGIGYPSLATPNRVSLPKLEHIVAIVL